MLTGVQTGCRPLTYIIQRTSLFACVSSVFLLMPLKRSQKKRLGKMTKWPDLKCFTLRCCQAIRRSLRSCISNTMIYNIAGFMMFYLWIQLHQTSNSEESSCHCLSLLKWHKWIQMDARDARDFSFRDVVWHDIHILYVYYIYIYMYIHIYIYILYIQYIYSIYIYIIRYYTVYYIYIYYTVYI